MNIFESMYKIKNIGFMSASYEELTYNGITRYDVRLLLLKCHDNFFVIEFEHSLSDDVYLCEDFITKIKKIDNIKEYLFSHKNFKFFISRNSSVDRMNIDNKSLLKGENFCYSITEEEFTFLDESKFIRVAYEKMLSIVWGKNVYKIWDKNK